MKKFSFFFAAILFFSGLVEARERCAVFFIPGAGGSNFFVSRKDFFGDYVKFFEEKGCAVHVGVFPPDVSIEESALVLRDQVERFKKTLDPKTRLVMVGHSKGGLDGRFALKSLNLSMVSALVTIGTPHLGTPAADWTLKQRERRGFVYWILRVGQYDLDALNFLAEMTGDFLKKHERHFEAVPGVYYASARARCLTHCHWALNGFSSWLGLSSGDGLVPAENQRFGDDLGEFDLDHISEVGLDLQKRAERHRLLRTIWGYLLEKRIFEP